MTDYARKPDVRVTAPFQVFKCAGVNVREFAGAVLGVAAVFYRMFVHIAPKTRNYLIYKSFAHYFIFTLHIKTK